MNKAQQELLVKIVADKYSIGAFAGMVYNQLMSFRLKGANAEIEDLIGEALNVRLKMEDLANETKSE